MTAARAGRLLTRREFVRLAALGAVGTAAASSAASPPAQDVPRPGASPGGQVQLVYQDWRTDWFPPMAQRLLDQFHATHPDIRVFYTLDPENLEEKMPADMQAGTAADVFQGCCSFFPIWAQKGFALDLRPYVQADLDRATIEDWDPAQYRALFTRDGLQFGLPKYHGALALYYNKDLFDAGGAPYPTGEWTHDDYLEAMRRLTRNAEGVWGSMLDISWERIQVHVNAWGGHFVDPDDPAHSQMADPPALEAMEWLRARMWDDKVMATSLDVQNTGTSRAFADGKLAMVEDGSWALKTILSSAAFRVGVAPFPAGPARRATLATTDAFGIFAGTRHPEAAWELVKFLISQDCGRAMAKAHFLQPARASLVRDWIGYIQAEYPDKAEGMDLAAFAEGHIQGYSVVAETFANMDEAQRIAYAAWDRLFTLGQAGTDDMKTASLEIEAAQAR